MDFSPYTPTEMVSVTRMTYFALMAAEWRGLGPCSVSPVPVLTGVSRDACWGITGAPAARASLALTNLTCDARHL
jgi:hypothetical protein